jgi:TolB-like protein/class 3 adenylate cyclase
VCEVDSNLVSEPNIQRRLVAILAADIVGFARLAGADEDGVLARLRALRSDLIDPTISTHQGRVVKRTGDGLIVEFRSVVHAVRCAIELQNGTVERNGGLPAERRFEFRIGIHLSDVVEEADGDLMGDGVNIAVRIEGVAEPGAVFLSEDAYRQVRDRVKLAFTDMGDKTLKNIARPIRVFALRIGSEASPRAAHAAQPEPQGPPRLSIVVLPFANMGGEPEQQYLADGVTESLTTDLSRMAGMLVIGRDTAFTYTGKAVDIRQVGRELNVRYVLEGSVQRGGARLRVNVQLIETESGVHIWAERFDKPFADFLEMQDEIVAHLANALDAQLVGAEARRAERAPNPDSIDLYFQARAWVNKGISPDALAKARGFIERALALDPANVDALAGLAAIDIMIAANFFPDDRLARYAAAEAATTRALSMAPDHAMAHFCLGMAQIYTDRVARGIAECERALELDRNLTNAHGQIGVAKLYLGRADETEAHILEALRLSPRDTWKYLWCMIAGWAKLHSGRDEEAAAWLHRSIETNRNFPFSYFYLAAALAHLGRLPEARSEVQAGLALFPSFTIARLSSIFGNSDIPVVRTGRQRLVEGLRKAGVAE